MAIRQILTNEAKLVAIPVTATRPSSASDGMDVTSWRAAVGYAFGPVTAALFLEGTVALTLSSPTGGLDGPEIWGYRFEKWWRAGYLNNGLDIEIVGADQGFATEVDLVGIFDRLAVAGTPSVGEATANLVPILEWQNP